MAAKRKGIHMAAEHVETNEEINELLSRLLGEDGKMNYCLHYGTAGVVIEKMRERRRHNLLAEPAYIVFGDKVMVAMNDDLIHLGEPTRFARDVALAAISALMRQANEDCARIGKAMQQHTNTGVLH